MKKIFLIGDSIRMGYDKYVKEALSGAAEVYYPEENSRFAEYVLRYAHTWKNNLGMGADVDLVHWNAGLWDVLELFGDGPLTPIDFYAAFIKRIDKRLRFLFPHAKIVFATSTSVIEGVAKEFIRHNDVIDSYNRKAIEALAGTDTVINDLYALTKSLPDTYHSDATHYNTPEATEIIGGRVISVICSQLGIKAGEVNIENFEPEKYTADNIGG
ncbi:MAG: SGNH/GDSL hydrolase family protein [Ruminococcaceae bacterium]|nr:SGNH/GDSL hydrolase family protein [Oscillospiraceae bacterium]